MNLYQYAVSDPLNFVDTTGYDPRPVGQSSSTDPYEPANEAEVTVVGRRLRDDRSTLLDVGRSALSLGIGFTPLGTYADVATALTGRDLITGERVSGLWRVAGLVPGISELRKIGRGANLLRTGEKVLARGCGCFEKGTLVSTPIGLRRIEEIKVGDKVLAVDEKTGKIAPKTVTALIRPEPKPLYDLRVLDANGEVEQFRATDDHPWKVQGRGWVETNDLRTGDLIATASGKPLAVRSLMLTSTVAHTYNLTVEEWHTFLVGNDQAVVHNSVCRTAIGRFTKTVETRIGKGGGQSRAEYTRFKTEDGRVIRTYKDSYDRAGVFQHRKPLRGGPEGRSQ